MEMKMEMVQTVRIISPALLAVLFLAYSMALVMAQYLSRAITQSHTSQMKYPSLQLSMTMYMMLKGMTSTATRRSVTAREQISPAELTPEKKGAEKKSWSTINEVVTREYTINIHKHIHGMGSKNRIPQGIQRNPEICQEGTPDMRLLTQSPPGSNHLQMLPRELSASQEEVPVLLLKEHRFYQSSVAEIDSSQEESNLIGPTQPAGSTGFLQFGSSQPGPRAKAKALRAALQERPVCGKPQPN
ncbi:hypothetical protein Celaphus_00018961 [Cervus elaphus hippelaphus]|uniref:Uncharacterized protein n=1 Tax=Cervus elaphus hippelaphus TaxID=46360 RepID=A0A212C797_CEREH|nr:hypothetical protein Celaphus_00018961 [Cervus elaphus hippelaphus]